MGFAAATRARARWSIPHFRRAASVNGGFDVNTPDADGRTLLHFAVAGNQPELAEMLIVTYRARATIPDAQGVTAVDLAAQSGNPNMLNVFYGEGLLGN